jgi:hypothetical protein
MVKCSSTLGLYVGQLFSFSGALFGGVVPFAEYTVQNIISRSVFAVSIGETESTVFPGAASNLPAVPQLVVFAVNKPASEYLFICQSTAGLRPYMPVKFLNSGTFVSGIIANSQVYYIKSIADHKSFSLYRIPDSGDLLSANLADVITSTNAGNCDIFYFNNKCKKAVVVVPYAGQVIIASIGSPTSTFFSSSYLDAVVGLPIVFLPNLATLSPASRGLFVTGSIQPDTKYYVASSESTRITVTGFKLSSVYVSTAAHFTECQKIRFSSTFGNAPVVARTQDYFIKQILHDGAIEISTSCSSNSLQVDDGASGATTFSSWPVIYSVDEHSQSFDLFSYYKISKNRSETNVSMQMNINVIAKRQSNLFVLDSSSGIIQGIKIGSPVIFFGPLLQGISKFGKYRIDYTLQTNPDAFSIQYDTGKGVLVTGYSNNVFSCTSTFDYRSGDAVYFTGVSFASSISVIPGDVYVIQAITSSTTFELLQRDASSCTSGVYNGACMKMTGPVLSQSGSGTAPANSKLYMIRAAKLNFVNLDISACTTNEISCLRQAPESVDAATSFCAEALTIGAKVRFSSAVGGALLGGLIADNDYYISSTVNGSSFTISTNAGGGSVPLYTPVALTPTPFSRCVVTQITNAMLKCEGNATITSRSTRGLFISSTSLESFTVGQQVMFSVSGDNVFFGAVYGSVIYTIRSIEGDFKFTISATEGGILIHDGSASSGTMTMKASPFKASKFSVGSRVRLFARERALFTAVSGFAASTTYYITQISKATNEFSISASAGGDAIGMVGSATPGWIMMTWSDTKMSLDTTDSSAKMNVRFGNSRVVGNFAASIGSMSVEPKVPDFNPPNSKVFGRSQLIKVISCSGTSITLETGSSFDVGDSLIFTGGFGNLIASRRYFIQTLSLSSISSNYATIELSTHLGAATLTAGTVSSISDVFAYITDLQHSVQCTISSALTFSYTCSSLSLFSESDAVVFVSNTGSAVFGGIDADSVYFVRKIIGNTHVTLSTVVNGPAFVLSDSSGSMTMTKASAITFLISSCTSTTLTCSTVRCALFLNVSSPIVFEKTAICGIIAGRTYFVHSIVKPTEFSISTFIGSAAPLTLSAATDGAMPFYLSAGILEPDLSNFQRHLVPSDRNSQFRITNQRPLPGVGCEACKVSQSALMCSPRNARSSKNSLETIASNSTVSVGDLAEFTVEASFLFYDCSIAANREQIVFGRDGMQIKVAFCLILSVSFT